ncbi:hypothetical protein GCM10009733_039470 [Nonomuraea maheshkhaliensis]|uniref:HTH lysR-type domain-containing protein n=1 Tax=Nonomuraea maheshkhaliensis TaxID=419590 RepID=A0ABN2FB22_9ACTN
MDLNLLTVLDALLEEGSVMGAAERLGLSSPALSRTLGRLRKVTGDDILVRTGHTMTPTPYALAIREDVHRLVGQAHDVLAPARRLDLATLERTFTIRCHDALAATLVPALVARIQERALAVRLRAWASTPPTPTTCGTGASTWNSAAPATPTATSPTWAAPTTCSRRATTRSARSSSNRC